MTAADRAGTALVARSGPAGTVCETLSGGAAMRAAVPPPKRKVC
jgi:hypothetical protein